MRKIKKFSSLFLLLIVLRTDLVAAQEISVPSPEEKAEPLTLKQCYELALKRSETLAIKQEDIKLTEAQFLKAAGAAIGDMDFVMTGFQQDAPKSQSESTGVGSTFSAANRRERKFVLSQPLFQGFKSLGAVIGAGSLRKQRIAERERAEQLLYLDVVNAFYLILRYKEDIETIKGIHNLYEGRIEELKQRENIGRSRESEVLTARSRMSQLEADLAGAQGSLALAQSLLDFLTGLTIDPDRLQDSELQSAERSLRDYLQSVDFRPDVKAAEQAAKTAFQNIVVTQSDLWPGITLEHDQFIKREGFQKDIDWDLLLKVNVPIYRGGTTVGAVKESIGTWKKSQYTHSLTRREAEKDIRDSFEKWTTSQKQYEALKKAFEDSEKNFQIQKEEYTQNLVNNLDVLEALASMHQTQRQANQAHYEMKENYWRLKIAAGEAL